MIAILSALATLFLITALGYALAAMKFGGGEMWHALDHITEPIAKRRRFEALGGVLRLAGRHFR
jgi:hypothetical protein